MSEATTPRLTEVPGASQVIGGFFGAVVGLLVALPLSYYFQPGVLRMLVSLPQYCGLVMNPEKADESIRQMQATLFWTGLFSILACGIIGVFAGVLGAKSRAV